MSDRGETLTSNIEHNNELLVTGYTWVFPHDEPKGLTAAGTRSVVKAIGESAMARMLCPLYFLRACRSDLSDPV